MSWSWENFLQQYRSTIRYQYYQCQRTVTLSVQHLSMPETRYVTFSSIAAIMAAIEVNDSLSLARLMRGAAERLVYNYGRHIDYYDEYALSMGLSMGDEGVSEVKVDIFSPELRIIIRAPLGESSFENGEFADFMSKAGDFIVSCAKGWINP